ncbi:MAG: autotransporter outer membrane beta-barrel domain-containing protein, partial [Deltaproteobacteria bacterium]|nr:autotransporter outer membrane beta-barrel domain-containing protein [Deltaproteobacteria bacterium]
AAAFGGLGAGLAGGANMGVRSELPSLAKLVNDSAFNFSLAGWNWTDYSNMTLWGSGGVTLLKGSPVIGGAKLDYEGDSTAFFIGGENYLRSDVLAGVALGFSLGDLDFTDHAASGYTLTGGVESEMVSIHPYASWWLAPDVNVWLSLGYGTGTVNLRETIGESSGRRTSTAETDQESISVTVGATGRLQVIDDATSLALNFQITRVQSDLDAALFDNGAQLAALNLRSTRIGGEAELGRDFALPMGMTLRPFATAQLRLDLGDAVSQDIGSDRDAAIDLGGGADLNWPDQGVTLRLSGLAQLNDTGHREHRIGVDVNYDLGADGQGLTMALQSAFSARRTRTLAARGAGAAAGALSSAGLGTGGLSTGGLGSAALGSGSARGGASVQQSLSGEVGYGIPFRQFGRSGIFTPYGRFDLGQNARWTAGLRLTAPRSALEFGLEAGVEGSPTAADRNYDLLLKARLHF